VVKKIRAFAANKKYTNSTVKKIKLFWYRYHQNTLQIEKKFMYRYHQNTLHTQKKVHVSLSSKHLANF